MDLTPKKGEAQQLRTAAGNGDIQQIQHLIKEGVDVNAGIIIYNANLFSTPGRKNSYISSLREQLWTESSSYCSKQWPH